MQCLPKQVVNVLPVVGATILTFLHFMISVYEIFQKYFNVFMYKWSRGTMWKHLKCTADEVALVAIEVKKLGKVPKHLVIILGTETLSVNDVVNIVVWSFAARIPFVSFHDYQGSLKKQKDQLDEAFELAVGKKLINPAKNGLETSQNGSSHRSVPRVSILDASNGKELLVKIVRKLCAEAGKGLGIGRPTQDELDEILIKETGLPEAQLAIYLGSVCCMYGFMPWHARITEFLPLLKSDNITVMDFVSVLRKYNKCEQR